MNDIKKIKDFIEANPNIYFKVSLNEKYKEEFEHVEGIRYIIVKEHLKKINVVLQ